MATAKPVCSTPFDLSMVDFKCSESELIETKKVYELQCNHLSNTEKNKNEKQRGLWRVLTFERLNRIPLFPLIIDSFMRDRLNYYYKTKQTLSSTEWVKEYNTISNLSQHININNNNTISNKSQNKTEDLLKGCVDTFGKRYSTFLCINDIDEKYDDSLQSFTSWIIETTSFIKSLISKDKSLIIKDKTPCPFQVFYIK